MADWINYHHLYYFKVIATEGGVARAAEKLRLGQPTLSAQLKQLEEQLGIQLFDRQHKKLSLTEAGRAALEYANEIFRLGDEMREVLRDTSASSKRIHVQVAALDSVPKSFVAALARAAHGLGNCSVSILEGKGDELLRELLAHKIDLVLADYSPQLTESKGLYVRRIGREPVVICGAPAQRGLRKGFPRSLAGKRFVLPTAHGKLRSDLDHYFRTNGISIDVVAETQDTAIQLMLGADGIGLVPLPETAAVEREKSLVRIGTLPGVYQEFFLIAATRKIENPGAARLLREFQLHD